MGRKIVPHHLTVLHHESNTPELGEVGDGVSVDRYEVGEFPRLDGAYTLLPAEHCPPRWR